MDPFGVSIIKKISLPLPERRTPRTRNEFFLVLQHAESGSGTIFFKFLEWCIQMVLLSHFYHSTVIPMSEQQQSIFCAAQSCRGLAHSRVAAFFFCQTTRIGINSLCSLARAPTHRVQSKQACKVVKHIPNVRKIRPGGDPKRISI